MAHKQPGTLRQSWPKTLSLGFQTEWPPEVNCGPGYHKDPNCCAPDGARLPTLPSWAYAGSYPFTSRWQSIGWWADASWTSRLWSCSESASINLLWFQKLWKLAILLCGKTTWTPTCDLFGEGWVLDPEHVIRQPVALSWEGKTWIDPFPFKSRSFYGAVWGPGRSQRVTTPHCSCGTVHISRTWGQTVFWNQNLTHRNQQVKGGWLLLVCHFLDALQTFFVFLALGFWLFGFWLFGFWLFGFLAFWLLASVGFWLLASVGFWPLASVGFWLLGFCWLLSAFGFWLLLAFGFCLLLAFVGFWLWASVGFWLWAFVGFWLLAFCFCWLPNEAAKTRRNEGTKTRRNEAAKTRRNEEMKQPRQEETKAWRKQNTKTRRNEAPKLYLKILIPFLYYIYYI